MAERTDILFIRSYHHALIIFISAMCMVLFWSYFRIPDGNLLMVTFSFLAASFLFDVPDWCERLRICLKMAFFTSLVQGTIGIFFRHPFFLILFPSILSYLICRSFRNRYAACSVLLPGFLGFFAQGGFHPSFNRMVGIFIGTISVMLATSLGHLVHFPQYNIPVQDDPFSKTESFRISFILGAGILLNEIFSFPQGEWIMLTILFIYLAVNETHDWGDIASLRIYSVPLGMLSGVLFLGSLSYFNFHFVYLVPLIGVFSFFLMFYTGYYFYFTMFFMMAFTVYSDWATGVLYQVHVLELILSRSLATVIGVIAVYFGEKLFPDKKLRQGGK